MTQPRASNPSGSSLLDKSTAKPGNVDMSIFDKNGKLGQGVVNSGYLQQCRIDNPENAPTPPTPTLLLSECKINTPANELAIGEKCEIECRAEFINNCTPSNVKITFAILFKTADGEEELSDKFIGYIDLGSKSQTVVVTDILPSPHSEPPEGTSVVYKVVASHQEAEKDAISNPLETNVRYSKEKNSGESGDRTITVLTEDGGKLPGAQYVLFEGGKKLNSGSLNENSQISFQAKSGMKYSVHMLNSGPTAVELDGKNGK